MEKLLSMTLQEIYTESLAFNTIDEMSIAYGVKKKFLDDIILPTMFYKMEENNRKNCHKKWISMVNEVKQKSEFYKKHREKSIKIKT